MMWWKIYLVAGFAVSAWGWWRSPIDSPGHRSPGWFALLVVALTWPVWLILWAINTWGGDD